MKARSIKISISLLLLLILSMYYRFIHTSLGVLEENKQHFQKGLREFTKKVGEITRSEEFIVLLNHARIDPAMKEDSKTIESQLNHSHIDLKIFQGKDLRFWSTNLDEPGNISSYPKGLSLQKLKTGWFLIQKIYWKTETAIFRTPLVYDFEFPNQFLKNEFTGYFDIPVYFHIEKTSKGLSRALINMENLQTLGYLILDQDRYLRSLDDDQGWTFLISLIIFFYVLQVIGSYFLEREFWVASLFTGLLVPAGILWGLSQFLFQSKLFSIPLFNPKIFSAPPLLHSLGDYFLWTLFFIWLVYFCWNLFPKIPVPNTFTKLNGIRFIGFFLMGFSAFIFSFLFRTLILHANIPLDLTNIFNLNLLTFLVFGFLALVCIAFYYSLVGLTERIRFNGKEKGLDYGLGVLFLYWLLSYYFWGLSGLYLSWGISSLLIIIYVFGKSSPLYRLGIFLFGISIISSIQIGDLIQNNEKSSRITMAKELSNSRDSITENLLSEIGKDIPLDSEITDQIRISNPITFKPLTEKMQKRYFERNFPNFDIQYYLFSPKQELIGGPDNLSLENFLSASEYPTTKKISKFFYQVLGKIGLNNYFGVIPITRIMDGENCFLGTLVIRLNARFIRENNAFQELLLDQKNINEKKVGVYSYAFYKDGSLIDKYGKYPFSIRPDEFSPIGKVGKMEFKGIRGFDHLIYQPKAGELIVVSSPSVSFYKQGTLFSYILGFNLVFIGAITLILYFYSRLRELKGFKKFFEQFTSLRLLYKTRIQVSIVASVFLSLIGIGWITLAYVNNQYRLQQKDLLSNDINNLRVIFEREVPTDSLFRNNEKSYRLFLDFAGGHSQDLSLYNTEGDLIYTSLPKIFERGLLSQKMSPKAYFEMFVSGRTEFIQEETIGKLNFLSGYTPVRSNINNQVMGYLNLPYFANQIELKLRLSAFSNSLINVYIITFLLIGLFAIALANSLTNPLGLVEKSFGSTQIGDINKPIPWKRDDEIGDLISGYNKMIKTIEESAKILAKSERESAWREMAKQVAHEIKNPLTPLKLGIQHLERSWREKDIHFDEKFKRFTKTFIEQIDSLSAISTEFSNFAQMPAAKEEVIKVEEVLETVIHLFKHSENSTIDLYLETQNHTFEILADRDQIARAFTNLIKNSLQAIPEGKEGHIQIKVKEIKNQAIIQIQDNGSGIPQELYPKIFNPNFTTKGSGTGLGLAFVKSVVEQAGGQVSFESEMGVGTRFIIKIPLIINKAKT